LAPDPSVEALLMPSAILEVHNLHKSYGSAVAVEDVSFHVDQGEMFGLLGPNGAGKTTTLSIIAALLTPTRGMVAILNRRVTPADRELRRHFGIVPQELALYGQLTAHENLRFFGELYGLAGPLLKQRVEEVLAAVALDHRADRRVDTFSGGMKRRLNLGCAIVHRPELLLLDEPTVGVDPQSRNHIFEEIKRLNAAGMTVVYTSHYMEEVQALCPRVAIMDHGRVIACDLVTTLLNELPGKVRFQVDGGADAVKSRLAKVSGVERVSGQDGRVELVCHDVKATLVRAAAVLAEAGVAMRNVETEEPNLEQVFLHHTKRDIRD
jgi:ABC-2 type transport system ATP-binding protein